MREEENFDYEEETQKKKKKKKESFISRFINRDHPTGVDKFEDPILKNPNISNFFKIAKRNFSRLFSLNIYMVFGNFPIFFFFLALILLISIFFKRQN